MIERIERADDPRLEPYAHVGDPRWLLHHNLFVAEGRLVVARLIAEHRFAIHSILLTPAAHAALAEVVPPSSGAPEGTHYEVLVVDQAVMNGITGFNFHRGCLALARRPEPTAVDAFASARHLVALEGVGNPDNVGGIFRAAAAFGVDGVVLDTASADPLYRKAIRTSMGSALHVPFARGELVASLQMLRDAGFRILALTPRADATSIHELRAPDRWVVLAGAEGPGLSEAALAAADVRVRIPTSDVVDSLNVTVAVGIALSRLSTDHIPGS